MVSRDPSCCVEVQQIPPYTNRNCMTICYQTGMLLGPRRALTSSRGRREEMWLNKQEVIWIISLPHYYRPQLAFHWIKLGIHKKTTVLYITQDLPQVEYPSTFLQEVESEVTNESVRVNHWSSYVSYLKQIYAHKVNLNDGKTKTGATLSTTKYHQKNYEKQRINTYTPFNSHGLLKCLKVMWFQNDPCKI